MNMHPFPGTPPRLLGSPLSVYAVESAEDRDIFQGRSEIAALQRSLDLIDVPCRSRVAVSLEWFRYALQVDAVDWCTERQARNPKGWHAVHISAHGDTDGRGIVTTSNELVRWSELLDLLRPLAAVQNSGRGVALCLSTCGGAASVESVIADDSPVSMVVANTQDVPWADAVVGFTAFYHALRQNYLGSEWLQKMRWASGNDNWVMVSRSGNTLLRHGI